MKLLIGKMILYFILILVFLEVCVRVLHLYFEYPPYYINELNVKTYVPNQGGHYVTGNRRRKYAKFNINDQGFNSFRAYNPTENTTDIALIGDSFIEGFHQDFDKSIGRKIETKLKNQVNVYPLLVLHTLVIEVVITFFASLILYLFLKDYAYINKHSNCH